MPGRLRPAAGGWRVPAIAGLLVVVLGGLGFLRVWPPFAVVMSGSMAPTINTGDMVVLEHLRAPARIGQIVAVDVPDATRARYGYPPVVIHRVFKITPDGQIRTKGDARPQPDPFTVPRTSVDRTVIAHIPSGGRVLAFVHSAPGLLWLAFGGLLFFGLPLLDRQRDAQRRDADAAAGLHDQLAAVTGELARLHAEHARSREATDATLSQLDRLAQFVERAHADAPPSPIPLSVAADVAEATSAPPATSDPDDQAAVADPPAPADGSVVVLDASGRDDDVTLTPPLSPAGAVGAGGAASESTPASTAAQPSVAVAGPAVAPAAPVVVEVVDGSPAAAEPPAAPVNAGAVVAAVLPAAVPVVPGAVFVLVAPEARRPAARVGRWDEPPCSDELATTGWTAAPGAASTGRLSRTGGLVAASHA